MAAKANILAQAFLGVIAVWAVPAQVEKPKNPLGDSLKVVAEGQSLYNKTCTGCHGRDGGEGDRAPALDANRRYFRLSEAAIFETVKNGIAGTAMPSSGLPDTEVWKVVAFIRKFAVQPPTTLCQATCRVA